MRRSFVFGDIQDFIHCELKECLLNQDLDFGLFMSGPEGSAKSNNSLCIALEASAYLSFGYDCIAYEPDKFMNLITQRKQTAIVCDEGGDVLYSRDFSNRDQKNTIKQIIGNRFLNNLMIVNYPRVSYMDANYRDHRIDLLGVNFALERNGELEKGHCYFFNKSKIPLVTEYFGNFSKGKDYYEEDRIKGLAKYVHPDIYAKFPHLKSVCDEVGSPFWNNYLKLKQAAHDNRAKVFFEQQAKANKKSKVLAKNDRESRTLQERSNLGI